MEESHSWGFYMGDRGRYGILLSSLFFLLLLPKIEVSNFSWVFSVLGVICIACCFPWFPYIMHVLVRISLFYRLSFHNIYVTHVELNLSMTIVYLTSWSPLMDTHSYILMKWHVGSMMMYWSCFELEKVVPHMFIWIDVFCA